MNRVYSRRLMSGVRQAFIKLWEASVRVTRLGVAAGLVFGMATAAAAQTENPAAAPRLESMLNSAMAQASATVTGSADHKVALGLRLGGAGFGAGVSFRAFGGPLGVQAEYLHYGGLLAGFSFNEIQAAVLYRLKDITLDAPIVLVPYVGGGVTVVNSEFLRDSDIGGVGMGGVEVFFAQLPQVGVSGQFGFTTNDIAGVFGGAGFTVAAHWYFR
jgi:hypothetical protein